MTTLVKICGLSDHTMVQHATTAGADYLGFVHFPKSPRHVDIAQMASLIEGAKNILSPTRTVIVTVNQTTKGLIDIAKAAKPDMLQLHGSEPVHQLAELKQALPEIGLIKAFSISSANDFSTVADYGNVCDAVLLDAKAPKGADLPGGNGLTFDWNLIKQANLPGFWFLSGGLSAKNVVEACHIAKPPAIDVSSGVELEPGVKSAEKISELINLTHPL